MLLVVEPLHWAAASHLQLKKAYLQPDKCETFLHVCQACVIILHLIVMIGLEMESLSRFHEKTSGY